MDDLEFKSKPLCVIHYVSSTWRYLELELDSQWKIV